MKAVRKIAPKTLKSEGAPEPLTNAKRFVVESASKKASDPSVISLTNVLIKEFSNRKTTPIDDSGMLTIHKATKEGILFDMWYAAIKRSKLSEKTWMEVLHIKPRTYQDYVAKQRTLNTLQSENILGLTLLYDEGVNTFGTEEKFLRWMNTPNKTLGGIIPIDIIDTSSGRKTIDTSLMRIKIGIVA